MQSREVPRSLFQFEFDLERRILAEAELQGNPHLREQISQANGEADMAQVSPLADRTFSSTISGTIVYLLTPEGPIIHGF